MIKNILGEPIIRETGVGHTHYEETSSGFDTKNFWELTDDQAVSSVQLID